MYRRTWKQVFAISAASVMLLAACGGDDDDDGGGGGNGDGTATSTDNGGGTGSEGSGGAASGEPYQWGINAELSGPLSLYGSSIAGGVRAYVEEVNASGGIDGHPIELTELDNAGEQSRSAANATQLITSNDVNAIFGNTLSSNCSAAQPITERHKVPQACLSVAETSEYTFSLGPDNKRAAPAMISLAQQITESDQIDASMLMPTTLTSQGLKEEIQAMAEDEGVNLVSVEDYEITASDLSAQVATIVDAQPDVIFINATGPGFLTVLRGVRTAGLQAPLIWTDGTANIGFLAESNAQGVYGLVAHELVDPESASGAAQEYIDAVTPFIDGQPTKLNLNEGDYVMGYATARAFGQALEACGFPCSGEDLQPHLTEVEMQLEGLVPEFSYDEAHYPYRNWLAYEVVGTQTELVATLEAAPPIG